MQSFLTMLSIESITCTPILLTRLAQFLPAGCSAILADLGLVESKISYEQLMGGQTPVFE